MALRFHKMHGLGNDFVVIDARHEPAALDEARVRALADRRTGIGCDQLILIGPGTATPQSRADVTMRIWNNDGSEVSACGNATRCVPVLLGRDCTIETAAGILHAALAGDGATVDMGLPRIDWDAIPLAYAMDTARLPTAWGPLATPAAVNVGNPHLVFFVADPYAVDLAAIGPEIETDPLFPERINVNLAAVRSRDHLVMRTWERGAGLTRACGTGACATAVAAIRRGLVASPVTVTLPGGPLAIEWAPGGSIRMSGPATHVFTGEAEGL